MVLDARAQVLCNLGPVISGSLSDDHAQGNGVITTTGELVLAGLITARPGDEVQLGYITPDQTQVARFPRSRLRVLKAFANPLTRQTTVQVGDELAYKKSRKGGVVQSGLLDVVNGRAPGTGLSIRMAEATQLAADRLGLQATLPTLSTRKTASSIDMGQGYVQFLSDAMVSEGRIAYQQQDGTIISIELQPANLEGPSILISDLIDIAPTEGGEDPAPVASGVGQSEALVQTNDLPLEVPQLVAPENAVADPVNPAVGVAEKIPETLTVPTRPEALPITTPEAPTAEDPGAEGHKLNLGSSWTNSKTETSTTLRISNSNGGLIPLQITETNITAEETAGPDNRVLKRYSKTITGLAKVNQQFVEDLYRTTGNIQGGAYTTAKEEQYEYEEIAPEGLSEAEKTQLADEIRNAAYAANPEELKFLVYNPKFRLKAKTEATMISSAEAAGRLGVKDYNRTNGLPGGSGFSEYITTEYLYSGNLTKEIRRIFRAYGLTQSGQQAISKALQKASAPVDLGPFVGRFFDLVLDDVQVIIRTADEVESGIQAAPQKVAQNVEKTPKPVQKNVVQEFKAPTLPEAELPEAEKYVVPFLPDDVVDEDTGAIVPAVPEEQAEEYAKTQNALRIGHKDGLQVTAPLGVLPNQPLAVFHLRNADVMATYRVNGTSWAFDATSCLVSTDALYVGAAGGDVNGERWMPLPPGASQLPTMPATSDNGAQPLANAVVIEELPDVSDTASIAALLESLPDDEEQSYRYTASPEAVLLPYRLKVPITFQAVAQLAIKYVPGGVYKAMGAVAGVVKAQVRVVAAARLQVRLQLISSEKQTLAETFSAGMGMGGNLS
jgi:hypothetical protein